MAVFKYLRFGWNELPPKCIVLFFFFIPVSALEAQSIKAKIVGLGAATCSQFGKDVEKNSAVQRDYLAWAQGFMSGILLSRPPGIDEQLDLNPPAFGLLKQLEFLGEYCNQKPLEDFSDAVEALYKRLRKENAP
jgi:hypothetical protein